jgi:hypothetical protein
MKNKNFLICSLLTIAAFASGTATGLHLNTNIVDKTQSQLSNNTNINTNDNSQYYPVANKTGWDGFSSETKDTEQVVNLIHQARHKIIISAYRFDNPMIRKAIADVKYNSENPVAVYIITNKAESEKSSNIAFFEYEGSVMLDRRNATYKNDFIVVDDQKFEAGQQANTDIYNNVSEVMKYTREWDKMYRVIRIDEAREKYGDKNVSSDDDVDVTIKTIPTKSLFQ